MNTEIDNLTRQEALERIDELIRERKCNYVVTPNVDHIVQLENNEKLKDAYKHASLVLCDGKPLVWLSKLYGSPIKEKISGSDIFPQLCCMAAKKKYTMFFLGAQNGVAKKAAENLKVKYKELNVVGTYSPPIGFEKDEYEMSKIEKMIKKANPHILIVGLGCPKQELFMLKNRDKLGVPLSLGLGASLDFEAGNVKRAPSWMSNNGLEWLYRMVQDPKRLIKRYLWNDLKILKLAVKYKINR
ncbi:WecB/TagA/CpsF family glycosyltransferase [Selenomonas ruminantium]|nr:WecB/TagA/CpsF family glycosyltransferase [Selenomonas ruminantium]